MIKPYTDGDIGLADAIAEEQAALGGPAAMYWRMLPDNRDPLYGGPSGGGFDFDAPFHIAGVLLDGWNEADDIELEANAEGTSKDRPGNKLNIPRSFFDGHAPPTEGDVIQIFTSQASDQTRADKSKFYDVIKATEAQQFGNSRSFVSYQLTVAANSRFTPERRLDGQ